MDENTENFTVVTSDMPVIEPAPAAAEPEKKEEGAAKPAEVTKTNEDEKPRQKSRAQARIETLVKEKHELAREVERLKSTKAPAAVADEDEYKILDPDDFEDYDDYLAALEGETEKPAKKSAEPAAKSTDNMNDMPMVIEQIQDKVAELSDKYPDLEEKLLAMPTLTEDMLRAINESDEAGEVANYLANNPEEAAKMAGMSAVKMALTIGKIEAKLSNPIKDETKQPPKQKQTQAPEPISPVNGNEEYQKPLEEMSFSEYEKAMNAQQTAKKFW